MMNNDRKRTGIEARRAATLYALTGQEKTILDGIGAGKTAQAIADELCVSKRTVEFHTRNMFSKLGVHNRVEAINRARELGHFGNCIEVQAPLTPLLLRVATRCQKDAAFLHRLKTLMRESDARP